MFTEIGGQRRGNRPSTLKHSGLRLRIRSDSKEKGGDDVIDADFTETKD